MSNIEQFAKDVEHEAKRRLLRFMGVTTLALVLVSLVFVLFLKSDTDQGLGIYLYIVVLFAGSAAQFRAFRRVLREKAKGVGQ